MNYNRQVKPEKAALDSTNLGYNRIRDMSNHGHLFTIKSYRRLGKRLFALIQKVEYARDSTFKQASEISRNENATNSCKINIKTNIIFDDGDDDDDDDDEGDDDDDEGDDDDDDDEEEDEDDDDDDDDDDDGNDDDDDDDDDVDGDDANETILQPNPVITPRGRCNTNFTFLH